MSSSGHLVFAFGTLKEGFPNFATNRGTRVPGVFRTAVPYPLYLVGERHTPWMLDAPGEGAPVAGQVFRVHDETLAAMDRLERVTEPDGYRRRRVALTGGDTPGIVEAHAYLKAPEQLEATEVRAGPLAEYLPEHASLYRPRAGSSTATLHFLCGKAGAGKSTIARRIAAAENAILVSEDVWLARLFGDQMHTFDDYLRLAPRLKSVIGPLAVDLLRSGKSVVLDFPANTRATRAWFRTLVEQAGSAHVLHYVDVSDATCLRQIDTRNAERPEGSHHLSEADFAHISSFFEAPGDDEGFSVRLHGASPPARDPAR